MKKEFKNCPACFEGKELYGFDWKEHVVAIPSPLVVVTSYKANGKTNATLQSWLTFSNSDGFYCIFADVSKYGHMYQSIKEQKSLVINFPSADIYPKCYSTIANNQYDDAEIEMAGLTAEEASTVHAPRIKECFLNLECEYVWEKELTPDSYHIVMCVKVINVVMDEEYYNEQKKGRYGNTGYLYNIHSPANPETGKEEDTYLGILKKIKRYREL
ncbi:MAG: flavin reductase [Lachnospiraceae bacterium]|nr:flavin reductase [Lachnospiraceae bacterium]